jgi:hypothetical protein
MAGSGARPPVAGLSPSGEGRDFTRQEAADTSLRCLKAYARSPQGAQMPFLAYLLNVALEEANNEKASHR